MLNLATNTFNEAITSYFHKSVGGYSPAKLWRYQDLIDYQIIPEMQRISSELQGKETLDSSAVLFQLLDNIAELAIRMCKVKTKIFGSFRSVEGAQNFATIRSYISTMQKQGKSVFEALLNAVNGRPYTSGG